MQQRILVNKLSKLLQKAAKDIAKTKLPKSPAVIAFINASNKNGKIN